MIWGDNQQENFAMATIPRLVPGATGEIVKALQHALIANGCSVGADGANGVFNDDTTSALEAFQDNAALPVQPLCDQACWTALYSGR
jgi:peptidoglycan hydrolase-like protein with peptidoglycan-binding domain